MTITSAKHKAILASLFYVGGTSHERRFPMATVHVAARCLDKLKEGATITVDGGQTNIQLTDGATKFDAEETGLLRDLLSGLTEATPTEFQLIGEVHALLNETE